MTQNELEQMVPKANIFLSACIDIVACLGLRAGLIFCSRIPVLLVGIGLRFYKHY